MANQETDARILGALQGVADVALPATTPMPAIDVEARELPNAKEKLLALEETLNDKHAIETLKMLKKQ